MLRTYSSVHNLWNLRQCSKGGEGPAGEGEGGVEVLPQAAHFHKAARTLRRVPVLQFDCYQIVVNVHLALIFRHASQINEMSPVIRI